MKVFDKLFEKGVKKISITEKLTLVSIALMVVSSCGKKREIETPTEFKTFSKYGFSFKYPKAFSVTEIGLFENEANNRSGMVRIEVENEEIECFQVSWIKTVQYSLEEGLEGGLRGMKVEGIASIERGERVEATKAGHRTLYQYYTATSTEGDKIYGIVGVLYCDKSQKAFGLITINNTISTKQDVLEDFQNYLDSFVCH